jgi:hypothetical protein
MLRLPDKKERRQAAPAIPRESVATGPKTTLKKASKKRVPPRKRTLTKPSFSNLPPAKSRLGKKTRGVSAKYSGLSAGMPGNEDVDPPHRFSTSTPADRARAILKG